MTGPRAATIGVVGAGIMGSGIAELGALSGARTLLHDPSPAALTAGVERVRSGLGRVAQRGRVSPEGAAAALGRLEPAPALEALAGCDLVIEAAPESLRVKHELFAALSEVVPARCVLATNTSSIPVTTIARATRRPERVVGMHFFNPAPRMELLEVVAGALSSPEAVGFARATGEAMGKRVLVVADGPGFLVNRCGRPFGLEALRLHQERIAGVEEIDRICRLGGGFPMGPFELMDLVGIDVGHQVARSLYEQSFGEPRWRPSLAAGRMVAAGRLGRKTGHGWYRYDNGPHRPEDPLPPSPGGGNGLIVISGESTLGRELAAAGEAAGWRVARPDEAEGAVPDLILDLGAEREEDEVLQGGPKAILCAAGSLAALDPEGSAVGFHALAPLGAGRLVELTRGPDTAPATAAAAERFFRTLGQHTVWVRDAPGLVLGRIVCQLVNEAAFALGEGLGGIDDIDDGVRLGLNHPRGPLAWGDAIGLDHVLDVLDGLADEYREERYRAAPLLRRLVASGRIGDRVGEGLRDDGPEPAFEVL